ncbi:hypothetical protein BDW62DRAFT_208729 [Aspergillus aurantiobrunneus]
MSQKRNFSSSVSGSSLYTKRPRPSYAEDDLDEEEAQDCVTPYERPRNHPVFGQKSAFPGLDTVDEDELFYGPAEDGLEYLRMVRSEANSLPTLFNAPAAIVPQAETTKVTDSTQGEKDETQQKGKIEEDQPSSVQRPSEGVYSDGVYIGLASAETAADETFSDAQASYYNLLHHRFLLLRSILKCSPPSEAISALDDLHPISFPQSSRNAKKEWRRLILAVYPQTVQLACMDMDSVLGVLVIVARLMSQNVRNGDAVLIRRIGAWAWGLLAKCRDAGQLSARHIGDIRELGKRAVTILRKLREQKEVQEEEENDYESDAENGKDEDGLPEEEEYEPTDTALPDIDHPGAEKKADAEELEHAKARLQARISTAGTEQIPQENVEVDPQSEDDAMGVDVGTQTRAMLDMIITIVGEYYGQRDLLEARESWAGGERRFLITLAMAPPLEISIPTTTTSTTSPPFTIYNITLRLPLRSFAVSKRYSDFTTFHTNLTSQTNSPPPLPLPAKSWFSNTVSNTDLRECRRQGLESYLRAINEAPDTRWRNSSAWRAFLNLPSLGNNNSANVSASSARLHAAATGPGLLSGTGGEPITDPTLWLDCYRDLKSQYLHDARLHLTRRDQETTPQKQHESSARAKSSLVRAGSLITALEDGLKRIAESNTNGNGSGRHSHAGSGSLGEGEIRRRKDLLINARKEKDGLEDLLNAMAAKSRVDNAIASVKDKEALVGSAGTAAGRKPARSGRILGKETERTRELDNQGVLQLQRDMMQDQDLSVEELMKVVRRQKELGIQINEELEVQNEMLRLVDEDASRLEQKVGIGKKRLGKIS